MERRASIDFLRIVSAMAVVIIHTVSAPVVNGPADLDAALVAQLNLVHTLMNWAVPVFFMISGYCVLRRAECTCSYCFRHVGRFVCVLFTVGLLYGALEEVYTTRQLNWLTLPHAVHMGCVSAAPAVYQPCRQAAAGGFAGPDALCKAGRDGGRCLRAFCPVGLHPAQDPVGEETLLTAAGRRPQTRICTGGEAI